MVPLATGTQTLGSTVRPASFCGIIGYKPTYNLIPRRGVWNDADTLDTVGLFARSVGDVALFASALLGYRGLLVPDNLTAPRVGLCRTFQWERATPEMKAALDSAGKAVAAAGALVKEVALPGRFADLLQASSIVALWEIAHSLADEYYRNGAKLRRLLHDRCTEGFTVDPENYQRAIALGRECRQMIPDALGDCDVLLAPAATGEAPKGLDWTGDPVFSQVWTFLHVPCVAVPAATGPNGLPLGVQVIGRLDEDARTLHAAHWIHRALEDKARR
jgi:Asp-tRNA(Asn)/Glu-tRNA(Gln) amidotransferase A subunit family amidase